MRDGLQTELHRALRAADERRAYVLLAAAGAAIAFAVSQTRQQAWSDTHWVWGTAVVLWCLSLVCGYRWVLSQRSALWVNFQLLRIERGQDEDCQHPQEIAIASTVGRNHLEHVGVRAALWGGLQYLTLFLGAVAYVGWHVWNMLLMAEASV